MPKNKKQQIQEDIKELVIARLKAIPQDFNISFGGNESLTRDEAIQNIIEESDLGREIIDIQLKFLKDMTKGDLYQYV